MKPPTKKCIQQKTKKTLNISLFFFLGENLKKKKMSTFLNKKRGKRNHHCGTTIDFVCGETPFARWNVDVDDDKEEEEETISFFLSFFRDDVNDRG